MEKQLFSNTIHKLVRIHFTLPVFNPHFLTLLLKGYNNLFVSQIRKLDYSIFNLNISYLNLPEINNPELIEEYEIAFTNYLKIDSPEQFNVGLIIKFLTENEPFAKYGFFRGFSNLIYTAVMSDSRSTSDIWLLSVFQKLLSFEI